MTDCPHKSRRILVITSGAGHPTHRVTKCVHCGKTLSDETVKA